MTLSNKFSQEEQAQATYENDATARRVTLIDENGVNISDTNKLPVEATLDASDIQIGAVEIKDGDTDTRLDVESDGTKNAAYVQANDLDIRDLSVTQDNLVIFSNTVKDGTGTNLTPLVDADGHLQVDILTGTTAGQEYTEGDVDTTITGTAAMGEAPEHTLQPLQLSASKQLLTKDIKQVELNFRMLQMLEKIERHLSVMTGDVYSEGDLTNRKK